MDIINTISTSGSNPTSYIALSSTEPNADGTGVTEPSGNGYSRCSTRWNNMSGTQQYVPNFPTDPTYDSGTGKYSITNIRDIYFLEATGSWGTLGYFAIYDAPTGGNLLAYGALSNAIAPTAGTIPVVRTGDLTIIEQ